MSDNAAINEKSFNELIMKIYKIKEELNEVFNSIHASIDSLKEDYIIESGTSLRDEFLFFTDNNFPVILENMDSYITDLKNARNNLKEFDAKLTMQIKNSTTEVVENGGII